MIQKLLQQIDNNKKHTTTNKIFISKTVKQLLTNEFNKSNNKNKRGISNNNNNSNNENDNNK